ncbi:MAG: cupin domain-containing protein [Woeseia sp.]
MNFRHRYRTMLILSSMIIGAAVTLSAQSLSGHFGTAQAAEPGDLAPPDAWSIRILNEMNLEALPDIDWMPVASGTKKNSESVLFEGDNTVLVWEAGPAKLIVDTPFTYDEFVVVLDGTLVLSDNEGNSTTYTKGEMFMVPKGFVGTWDMTEKYRELIVVDTAAYNAE